MNSQPSEHDPPIKIKFRAVGEDANHEDYKVLFPNSPAKLEGSWTATEHKSEQGEYIWILTHDKITITAKKYESGPEYMFIDIGKEVAAAAIISLMTFLWNKWRTQRTTRVKTEPSYEIETVLERFPDGRPKKVLREQIHGPVQAESIGETTAYALSKLGAEGGGDKGKKSKWKRV
jgi:hypothetical protein